MKYPPSADDSMGAAIDALGDSIGISTRNPNLVLGGVVAMILLFGVGGVLSLIPLVGPLVTNVVVAPVALAGMVAMANAAATDSSSFGDFTGGISDHSLTLMGAYALLFVIQMGIGILFVVAFFFLGFGALAAGAGAGAGPGTGDPGAMFGALGGTMLVVFLVALLVALAVALVTQFLDVAVVVGDADATGSFGEAIDLVTSGPLSVLGYSLLRGIVGVVVVGVPLGVGVGAVVYGFDGAGTLPIVLGLVVMLLAIPAGFAFLFAYHVAYYRRRTGVAA